MIPDVWNFSQSGQNLSNECKQPQNVCGENVRSDIHFTSQHEREKWRTQNFSVYGTLVHDGPERTFPRVEWTPP